MKILLTGATSSIGAHLLPALIKNNHHVGVVCRNVEDLQSNFTIHKFIKDIRCFLWRDEKFEQKIQEFRPELALHLAGLTDLRDDIKAINALLDANIKFGATLLHYLSQIDGLKYFIDIGSGTQFSANTNISEPSYLYSATKSAFQHIAQHYCRKSDLKYFQAILYNVYGCKAQRKNIIDYLIESLDSNNTVSVTPGEQRLDFIHIADVVEFFLLLINYIPTIKEQDSIFYVGTGKAVSIKEIARILEQITTKQANLNWGGIPYRPNNIMYSEAPIELNSLSWKADLSLRDGLIKYIDQSRT